MKFNVCLEKPLSVFRILLIALILFNGTNQTKLKDLRNEQNKTSYKLYRNGFYDICTRVKSAGRVMIDKCSTIEIEYDFTFGCPIKIARSISKNQALPKHPKKLIKLNSDKYSPFGVFQQLLNISKCKDKKSVILQRFYNRLTITGNNNALVQIKNALRRDDYFGLNKKTKFYENSEDVFSFNPRGKEIALSTALRQLNLSFFLLNKHIFKTKKIIYFDSFIQDLVMEKAALFLAEFIGFVDAYHQLVYICALDSKNNRALHFLVDRGLTSAKTFDTRVRFILYHISPNCDNPEDMPDQPVFNFNFLLFRQGKEQNKDLKSIDVYIKNKDQNKSPYKPKNPILSDVQDDRKSFAKLFIAVQRYAIRYKKYGFLDNCQHFATGMFNYITNSSIPYVNGKLMDKIPIFDVSKDPFNILFKNMTDDDFRKKATQMIKDNN